MGQSHDTWSCLQEAFITMYQRISEVYMKQIAARHNNKKCVARSAVHITRNTQSDLQWAGCWKRRNPSGPLSPTELHAKQDLACFGKRTFYCCDFVLQVKLYVAFTRVLFKKRPFKQWQTCINSCWRWWQVYLYALESRCAALGASALSYEYLLLWLLCVF